MYLFVYIYLHIYIHMYICMGGGESKSTCVRETVGPHKKTVIIHVTDREM